MVLNEAYAYFVCKRLRLRPSNKREGRHRWLYSPWRPLGKACSNQRPMLCILNAAGTEISSCWTIGAGFCRPSWALHPHGGTVHDTHRVKSRPNPFKGNYSALQVPPQVLLNNQQTGWHLEYGFSSVSSTFHRHSLYPWAINFISKKAYSTFPSWKDAVFSLLKAFIAIWHNQYSKNACLFFFPWVGGGFGGFFCLKPLWTGQR